MEEKMKKTVVIIFTLCLLMSLAFADDMEIPTIMKPITNFQYVAKTAPQHRDAPSYTFSKLPTPIITNYYDYMIGSYNGLPLKVIPQSAGGGYFMTYHGRRQAGGTRRAFYTYIDAQGNIQTNNEITNLQNHEGYPTIEVDKLQGKPMYAWHANKDSDSELEVEFASDSFLDGITGLFNYDIIINNPITITAPNGTTTTDNEFIWPNAQIGPSPIAGKQRIYVVARNSVTHNTSGSPSENPYIAYADFEPDDIINAIPLVWHYTSIPEMNQWNVDVEWRRPFHAITADDAGNLYYAGYHFATESDATTNIDEPDLDVFICPNYGEGTWRRVSSYSHLNMWNPNSSPTDTTGYFDSPVSGLPFGDNGELYFGIASGNSGHINATMDNLGRIHVFGVWSLQNIDGYYYPEMEFVKEFIFDPATEEFSIREVYPQKDPEDNFNTGFCPWDYQPPFGEVDEYVLTSSGYAISVATGWPFPHWDDSAHSDAMEFHYNNCKITSANEQGMMAAVWQDSRRARDYNYIGDTSMAAYANTPEIWISISPDNGNSWSDPIIINNVDTPEFAGIKPMWVYPADQIQYVGTVDGHKIGKLGIMFYNDYTWGANVIDPPYHQNPDGGQVMFMELLITAPVANEDLTVPNVTYMLHQNYPNPFNPQTTISFDMPKAGFANLSIYNVKGQLVKNLVNDNLDFGRHSVVWNGTDNNGKPVTSGLYLYRLTTNGVTETKKMMLMK